MQIDITKLLTNHITLLNIEGEVNIPKENLSNSLITDLKKTTLTANIKLDEENELVLTGTLKGTMLLRDDITLEPVEYDFNTNIEEFLDKNQNVLDITDILWQNILVEIPSKVRNTFKDVELKGNGWRVISEEQFNKEMNKANNPFADLDKLLNTKEEK